MTSTGNSPPPYAKIYIAGIKAEFPEAADRVELTFNAVDFPPGSEGTVEALNWFIDRTCLNQG